MSSAELWIRTETSISQHPAGKIELIATPELFIGFSASQICIN
ncbi:hypothetical protein [Legionella erythra]|nr:hypothetical protein [Legionella erythra]